jgi:hypothetical protein
MKVSDFKVPEPDHPTVNFTEKEASELLQEILLLFGPKWIMDTLQIGIAKDFLSTRNPTPLPGDFVEEELY